MADDEFAERCEICGHSLKVHNDLGYCWVSSKSKGQCACDMTRSSAPLSASGGARRG